MLHRRRRRRCCFFFFLSPFRRDFLFFPPRECPARLILLLYGPFSKRFPREKPITLSTPLPSLRCLRLARPRGFSLRMYIRIYIYLLMPGDVWEDRDARFRPFSPKNNTSPQPAAGHCLPRCERFKSIFVFKVSRLVDFIRLKVYVTKTRRDITITTTLCLIRRPYTCKNVRARLRMSSLYSFNSVSFIWKNSVIKIPNAR